MAGNTNMYKGDLVKWFEYYVEGIVKDAGLGTVVEAEKVESSWIEDYMRYKVWRHQKNDFIWCSHNEVELLIIK